MRATREVFAYGTLLFPEVMEAVTGRRFAHEEAVLEGVRRRRVRGQSFPAAIEAPGERTAGRLYRGVDAGSLALLDRFEGELYVRRRVQVRIAGGAVLSAEVWLLAPRHAAALADELWDPDEFARGPLASFLESCRRFRAAAAG